MFAPRFRRANLPIDAFKWCAAELFAFRLPPRRIPPIAPKNDRSPSIPCQWRLDPLCRLGTAQELRALRAEMQ